MGCTLLNKLPIIHAHCACGCEAQQREIGFCNEKPPQLQLPLGAAEQPKPARLTIKERKDGA